MTRILDMWSTMIILAMVHVGTVATAVAAPGSSDQLPLDWPSASNLAAENAKAQALADNGRAAYLIGDFATAISAFSELLKLKPADARVYYNRGSAYYQRRDLERALADFSESLKIAPNMYLALMNRGNIYSRSNRYDEAIADYDKAIALKPDQFLIYFNRGIAFGRLGDYAKALIDFTQAIRLNPKDAPSYASRGDVFYLQGEFESARKDFANAIELDTSQMHAAERLRILNRAAAHVAIVRPSIDTSSVAAEISHQYGVKRLALLVAQSCYQKGEDEQALRDLGDANKWSAVGRDKLKKVSNAQATMINGWTFSDEVGTVAVMQSKVKDAPELYICSVTAKVLSKHILDDFQPAFEEQFNIRPATPVEKTADVTLRYWLPHKPTCDTKTSVVLSPDRGTVTVRMLHGRKADGASKNSRLLETP